MKSERKINLLTVIYALYAGSIIAMNIMATKQFDLWQFTVTTGILVSPIAFIIQDVVTEVFGYKEARRMISTGFIVMLGATLFYQLAIIIPPSQYWEGQAAFSSILGTTLRISIASLSAYYIGSLTNAWVMDKLRKKYKEQLFFRLISSTIVGQVLDNLVFAVVAFTGILPGAAIASMVIGGTLFETIYEIILYPVTRGLIMRAKNYLEVDEDVI